jgi:Recombination endonuclease VII
MARNPDDPRWTRTCKACGKPYQQRRPKQLYCSRPCAETDRTTWHRPQGGTHADASLEPRICGVCEKEYQPTRVTQLACSRACRDKLPEQRRMQRERDRDIERRERQNKLRRVIDMPPEDRAHRRQINLRQNLKQYGMTLEEYLAKVEAQGNRCVICGSEPNPDGVKAAARLHSDHDHVTMKNRDLLCLNCNIGIGHFRDDPAILRAAAEYIERHRALSA